MQALEEVMSECVSQTGAWRVSSGARQVALVALSVLPDGAISMRDYRRRIKAEYMRTNECGSFFLVFVLPILISLVSNWIAKWILNHKDITRIRAEAIVALSSE
jgi:hypothetical protein